MHLPYDLDGGAARRATLGLIILRVDETVESDFRRLLPAPDLRLHHTRIPSAPEVTPDTLPHMAATLTAAAALLPDTAGLDVVGYACTSGATVLGEETVARLVNEAHPGVAVTNPLSALKAACRALGVTRLGLVSPYVAAVSQSLRENLTADGIAVTAFGSFDQREERQVARITPASILQALLTVGRADDCDAVFAACTNLRALDVLAEAEQRLGRPVMSSNQVLAWHMLGLAGVDEALPGGGVLGACSLPAAT